MRIPMNQTTRHWVKRMRYFLPALVLALAVAPAFGGGKAREHFGAKFTGADTVALADVVAGVEQYAGEPVRVKGTITDVCQRSGCWLVITDGEHQMRVTFKGGGFHVPTDVKNRKVEIEGIVSRKAVGKGAIKQPAGRSNRKGVSKTAPVEQEISMVATGVRISE
jgi:hypothetical protein